MHSVPFSHRSGERIEPLISLQWFCRMDELAAPAIEVVERDEVRIVPDNYKRVYLDWMRSIRPWCVSRQLWWGHRLPVWYCDACEETRRREPPERCGACGGELRREEDVLDTWFSSALWPFAVLGWPDETPSSRPSIRPTLLVTAREIIFLWVARMVMMGIEFAGEIPFRDVYIHSVIQAPDGRRMSKSLGTGIDPIDEIERYGADALRFGLLAMSSTQDVRYSAAKVQQGLDLANKMWNASRLILLNAAEVAARQPATPGRRVEDRWILSRLQRAIEVVTGHSTPTTSPTPRSSSTGSSGRSSATGTWRSSSRDSTTASPKAAATLLYVLEQTLALAHPVMPFVTEEIWAYLRGSRPRRPDARRPPLPDADPALIDEAPSPRSRAGSTSRAGPPVARPGRGRRRAACSPPASRAATSRPTSSSAGWPGSPSTAARASRSPASAPVEILASGGGRRRAGARAGRGAARQLAPRSRAPRASSPTGLRRQGAGRGGRGRAREAGRLPGGARGAGCSASLPRLGDR